MPEPYSTPLDDLREFQRRVISDFLPESYFVPSLPRAAPRVEPADLLDAVARMTPAERRRLKSLLDGAGSGDGLIVNPTASEVERYGTPMNAEGLAR